MSEHTITPGIMRAQSVATDLRRAVSAGEYAPGEKLNEVAVAVKLGVARNTLRECFATLAADGIVKRIPNRGVFIASPTPEDILSLFRARAVVEPGAVLWGAELDVDALDKIVSYAEATDFAEETALANQKFHRTLVEAAGSDLLNQEMDRLLARMRLIFLLAEESDPDFHRPFVAENRRIVNLLRSGDREAASESLRTSLAETGRRLFDVAALSHPPK